MQDAILLFGSGISLNSGMPTVDKLTCSLLHDEWYRDMDVDTYHPGKHPHLAYRETNNVPVIQAVLKALKHDWDNYLKKKEIPRPANYEDLYYACYALVNEEDKVHPSPAMRCYRKHFENAIINTVPKRIEGELWQETFSTKDLILCAMRFIKNVVWHKLSDNTVKPQGMDAIVDLAKSRDLGHIVIVTLNHDTLLERALTAASVAYEDGFTEPATAGDKRYFDRSRLDVRTLPQLLKLHGSVDWGFENGSEEGPTVARPYRASLSSGDAFKLMFTSEMLVGTHNKDAEYGFGIYREMDFRLHEALSSASRLLTCGYGWGDRGLNGRLVDWLYSSEDKRLVVLAENEFMHRFDPGLRNHAETLERDGRLQRTPKYICDMTAEDLVSLLQ